MGGDRDGCQGGGPALFFSLLVIVVSYFAIFTLEAQEGRLFKPLAFTSSYSMGAAALLAIKLVPLLTGYFIADAFCRKHAIPLSRAAARAARPDARLLAALAQDDAGLVVLLLAGHSIPCPNSAANSCRPWMRATSVHADDLPRRISITKAKELLQQTDKILVTFPEVESVFGKVGRAETATDPAPLSMIETIARLKPTEDWPDPSKTTKALMKEMDAAIKIPGSGERLDHAHQDPHRHAVHRDQDAGRHQDQRPGSGRAAALAEEVEQPMKSLPETLSAFGDRAAGGYFLDFDIRREAVARYGLPSATSRTSSCRPLAACA